MLTQKMTSMRHGLATGYAAMSHQPSSVSTTPAYWRLSRHGTRPGSVLARTQCHSAGSIEAPLELGYLPTRHIACKSQRKWRDHLEYGVYCKGLGESGTTSGTGWKVTAPPLPAFWLISIDSRANNTSTMRFTWADFWGIASRQQS
eukprot:2114567-Amphidinium_carterae.1